MLPAAFFVLIIFDFGEILLKKTNLIHVQSPSLLTCSRGDQGMKTTQYTGSRRVVAFMIAAIIIPLLPCGAFAEIRVNAEILPESDTAMKAILTVNSDALGLMLPAPDGEYVTLYWEDILPILSELTGVELSGDFGYIDEEALTSLAMRYGRIVISAAGLFNLSRKKMNYDLEAFGTSPYCTVWTFKPSSRDWSKMLTKLFSTALTDDELLAFLPGGAVMLLREGQQHISEVTAFLTGLSLQAAYDDSGLYAIRLTEGDENICYQSGGWRSYTVHHDALVYQKGETAAILVLAETDLNAGALAAEKKKIETLEELEEILAALETFKSYTCTTVYE